MRRILRRLSCFFTHHDIGGYQARPSGHFRFECFRCGKIFFGWSRP